MRQEDVRKFVTTALLASTSIVGASGSVFAQAGSQNLDGILKQVQAAAQPGE